MHVKYAAHTYKEEWDRRIGTEFPGVSIDALMGVASWAGIEYEALDGMNAWDIYQTAMTLLEERGLGINGRNDSNTESKSRDLANTKKLFPMGVPENTEIVDVAVRIDAAKGSGKSERQIAREYTSESKGNMPRAQSILSQIRRMKRQGRVNL
jgi:hypothetical protein